MRQYDIPNQLTLNNVNIELKTISTIIKNNPEVTINLGNITKIDSAGIALLIELHNITHSLHHKIHYSNITNNITSLCNLYQIKL